MLGFMCLFLPPVLMAYMWNRLVCSAKSLNMWVRNYIFSFLYLNGLTISVVTFVFKHTEDLVYKLNKYNSFALKYILCSLLFAALTIGVKIYLLQRFRLEISVSGIRPFQHWHTVAVIYAFLLFLLNQ